jgi:hypothetical protein
MDNPDNTPAPEAKAKRSRNLGNLLVAVHNVPADDGIRIIARTPFATVEAAKRWIRDSGDAGYTYSVIRLVCTMAIEVETVEKRTVTEVK